MVTHGNISSHAAGLVRYGVSLLLLFGIMWVAGTYLMAAFADPLAEYLGLAGHAKRLLIATPTGLASLSAVLVYATHVPTEGILWWNRFMSRLRRRRLLAEVTVSFTPDEFPTAQWLDERVRRWDTSGSLRRDVPVQMIAPDSPLTRLEYTSKLGRLVISAGPAIPEDPDGQSSVTLRLPRAPHESRTLLDLMSDELAQLVASVQAVLGAPDGVRIIAEFGTDRNPFLGVLLRSGISADAVTDLRMEIKPANHQPGDYVMVSERGMELRSGSHIRLVSLMQRYIALQ